MSGKALRSASSFAEKTVWKDIEDVLTAEESQKLHADTGAELLSADFRTNVLTKMSHGQPLKYNSEGLFVLGPSAAGKSHALREGIVYIPEGAITLDGGYIRDCSETWARTLKDAADRGLHGYSNYFQNYFKSPADNLKQSIVKESIATRANVVVPETASNLRSCKEMVDALLEAGYRLTFVAIYADKHVCEDRGFSRESEEGKKFSSKNWEKSVQAIIDVEEHLRVKGVINMTGPIRIFDNTGTLTQVDVDVLRSVLDENQAGGGGWLEIRLLAGVYEGAQGERVEFIPSSFKEEKVDVKISQVHGESRTVVFNVATNQVGMWTLNVSKDGKPFLSSPQGSMVRVADFPRKSLNYPITAVANALEGTNFLTPNGEFRSLTDDEFAQASDQCRLSGDMKAPARDRPQALFIVAPSGGGKSTVLQACGTNIGGLKADEVVVIDSGVFRDVHEQYRTLLQNGFDNNGIWYSAWPAVKKVISAAKKKIIDFAVEGKQDMFISDTGSDSGKLVREIEKLRKKDYIVHVCGIFADPQEIIARGVAREVIDGKRFNRDIKKLRLTFDAFAPAIQAINGQYQLVLNAQGKPPQVYQEGDGGTLVNFNLQEALSNLISGSPKHARQGSREFLPVVKLLPADFTYIMEGNLNIVCSYHGNNEDWENMVLRCRKGDNSTYRMDCKFAQSVAARLLGKEYIDTGDLIGVEAADMKAIDDAILESRPRKRRTKRLDTKVRDSSGLILACKVANLMAAPVDQVPVVTIELKPKCGLRERAGLPSRYKLLQYEKLNQGKIAKLSEYDPIKLLSKDAKQIHETLQACMVEPQNNMRIFIDGKAVFSEDVLRKHKTSAQEQLNEKLKEANLHNIECLLSVLTGVLSSPSMMMPDRLKRGQCWAAGETAPIANQLLKSLKDACGDATDDILAKTENFELATENIEDFLCDEAGIAKATQLMDEVLTRAHKRWDKDVEQDVIKCLCRFLLGRTCHDVSVLVNFVVIEPSRMTVPLSQKLNKLRFRPLDFFGLPLSWTGIWCRVSVVDTDAKSPEKIPEYATQLDAYAKAYYQRFEVPREQKIRKNTEATVANDEPIVEGDTRWVEQPDDHAEVEFGLLRHYLNDPSAEDIIPELVGVRVNHGATWLGMKHVLWGLNDPSMLELKMGTRTWNRLAPASKAERQKKKDMDSTSKTLGIRVVTGKLKNAAGDTIRVGHKNHKEVLDEAGLKTTLDDFLCSPSLRQTAIAKIRQVQTFWKSEHTYALYASSLLLGYDNSLKDACHVAMTDFAQAEEITDKADDVSGYDVGLDTLLRILSQ